LQPHLLSHGHAFLAQLQGWQAQSVHLQASFWVSFVMVTSSGLGC
jgi:hypothetical protein